MTLTPVPTVHTSTRKISLEHVSGLITAFLKSFPNVSSSGLLVFWCCLYLGRASCQWWHRRICEYEDTHLSNICICVHAKLLQSCPTLCNCMDCSPPGSSVHGSLQARILEWVAMPSSKGSSWPRDQTPALVDGFFTTGTTWQAWKFLCLVTSGLRYNTRDL